MKSDPSVSNPFPEIVKMASVSKAFPGVLALDGVSFSCKRGEIHSLVGENGAGKSTLIKILGGVFPPDAGRIHLRGREIVLKSPHAAQIAGIMIVHQEFSLVPYMSVTDNILLGQEDCNRLGLINSSSMHHKAEHALKVVKANLDPNALVVNLSAGEQKLVEIAKAIAAAPDILVVDEPTAPLTKKETQDLFNVLNELKQKGTAIVYISHHLEEIFQIADRVTVLKDGKKVATKMIGETSEDDVIKFMIGRELGDMFPAKQTLSGTDNIMTVRHLTRRNQLVDINFHLRRGEILGIAGLQGQGQDILLRTIYGALQKDRGETYIYGKRVRIRNPKQAIKAGMSLVTDKRGAEGLCLFLSVRDNLALPTLYQRHRFGVIQQNKEQTTVTKTIRELNILTPKLGKPVRFLSGGNQQKIIVGKWLIADPRIVLFINPTAGIDVGAKTELYRLMRALVEEKNMGIIMVTSDMLELIGLCDRILVMYEGCIVREISGSDANEETIMRAAVGRTIHESESTRSAQPSESSHGDN